MGGSSTQFVLGRGGPREDRLRGGALTFLSRRGVAPELGALVEELPASPPRRVLLIQDRDAVLALAARHLWPETEVWEHHLDAYAARRTEETLARHGVDDVRVLVTPDLPSEGPPFDLVLAACPLRGESLLAREWIERAHAGLSPKGRLLVGCDGTPTWLRKTVKEVFGQEDLQRWQSGRAAVIAARRRRDRDRCPERTRSVRVVRDATELQITTRPGVFSHGRLDAGTSALLQTFRAQAGERVLDLGCGAGALGLAAAVDVGSEGSVCLVDSNARAVALARDSAATAGLENVTVLLRADLEDLPGRFDLALANPPYFARGRIAEAFARAAARSLTDEGRLWLVAKAQELHQDVLESRFDEVRVRNVGDYAVFRAARPRDESGGDA